MIGNRSASREVTDAHAFGGAPKPKLEVLSFTPMRRNTLVGFVTVRLGSGLKTNDCPVHVHPGGRIWVALPGKPLIDSQGRHKLDVNNKPAYVPVAEWPDRDTSNRFSELVIAQLRQRFPNALEREDPT